MNKIRIGILAAILVVVWGVSAVITQGSEQPEPPTTDPSQTGPVGTEPVIIEEPKFYVLVDAGHGGKDPGALGVSGVEEKDLNLVLAHKVMDLFKDDKNIGVVLTREDDIFILPEKRYQIANSLGPDLFVSIHHNSFQDWPSVSGVETFYYRTDSLEPAEILHEKLLAATQFNDRGVMVSEYKVVKYTTMPSVLLEIGYLSNPTQEKILVKPEFQDTVAAAIAEGIREYYQVHSGN